MTIATDFFMAGAIGYLRGTTGCKLIDVVVEANGSTYVFMAGWWKNYREITLGQEVAIFAAPLVPSGGGYTVDIPGQSLIVEHPESEDFAPAIAAMRVEMDLERLNYREAWFYLASAFGWNPEDAAPWGDAVSARPPRTVDETLELAQTFPRATATLQLVDSAGMAVDAVAFDSRGGSASALGTPMGEWLASMWPPAEPGDPGLTAGQSLPDPGAFVAYYEGRTTPDGGVWSSPAASFRGGHLAQLAAATLSATLTT